MELRKSLEILRDNLFNFSLEDKTLGLPEIGDIISLAVDYYGDEMLLKYVVLDEDENSFLVAPVLENFTSEDLVELKNNYYAYPLLLKLPKTLAYKLDKVENLSDIKKEIYARVLFGLKEGYNFGDLNAAIPLNFEALNLEVAQALFNMLVVDEKEIEEQELAYAAASSETLEGIKNNVFIKVKEDGILVKNLSSENKVLVIKDESNKKYTLYIYPNEEVLIYPDNKKIKATYVF